MNFLAYLGVVQLILVGILAKDNLMVSLKDGVVKGYYKESYGGRKFIAFEGIPYARPPVGNLRFEDPQPVERWPGILEAVNTYTCAQYDPIFLQGVGGQEDCLYLNVYVPRKKIIPDEKLDVIAHMHGGGFVMGSPKFAEPDKIMDRDVVYVNFNYRLGTLGFYSIGDGRGNYGLKDQTAALQWIQDNIAQFGGNKDSVTITGMSAGGASVHYHYFSKLSKGLFHKGFAQSGMALNPWAIKANPATNAMILANAVGCSELYGSDIYECMKQRSMQQLMTATADIHAYSLLPFGPAIEENSSTSFLSKSPYSQLVDKEMTDLPLLISMAADEGTAFAAGRYNEIEELNKNWKKWFPLLLDYYHYDQEKQDDISEKIKEFYFNNEPITTENFKELIKASSHRMFLLGGETSARLQAQASLSNIYFMLVDYIDEFVPIPGYDVNFGAGHGVDGKYYYGGNHLSGARLTKDEERMKEILLDMMIAFAKTGDPNTDAFHIQPVRKTEEAFNYLLVNGPDDLHMERKSLGPHEFWSSLGLKEDANA